MASQHRKQQLPNSCSLSFFFASLSALDPAFQPQFLKATDVWTTNVFFFDALMTRRFTSTTSTSPPHPPTPLSLPLSFTEPDASICLSKLAAAEQLKLKFEDELHGFQLLDEASRGLLTSQLLPQSRERFSTKVCFSIYYPKCREENRRLEPRRE